MKTPVENKELIRQFLIERVGKAKKIYHVQDNENIIENGLIDSLGIMQLVTYLESTFQVKVRDEDIIPDHFESIDLISSYVARLQ